MSQLNALFGLLDIDEGVLDSGDYLAHHFTDAEFDERPFLLGQGNALFPFVAALEGKVSVNVELVGAEGGIGRVLGTQ